MKRAKLVTAGLLAVTAGGLAGALPAPTQAATQPAVTIPAPVKEPIVVGLGDSFMSGEGGRLQGNTYQKLKADGVYATGKQDRGWDIYRDAFGGPLSGHYKNADSPAACHRSDVSIVNTVARSMTWKGVNLACSGAITDQVTTKRYRTEVPQVERLAQVAADKSTVIKAVVLSIGGNDMGFSDVLTDCLQIVNQHDCSAMKDNRATGDINAGKRLESKRLATQHKITATLDAVTTVMRQNGYADDSYVFVYDGVPRLMAEGSDRYPAKDGYFQSTYRESPGVPFHERTVRWSNHMAVPLINGMMRQAAAESINQEIRFLDLTEALRGHELSSRSTTQYRDRAVVPQAHDSEWIVPLDPNYIKHHKGSPRLQESFHPNAYGQQAIGQCVTQVITAGPAADFACIGVPGRFAAAATATQ